MRTIKFRAKRVENGVWVYGVPYCIEGIWWILVDTNSCTDEIGTGSYQIIPETVGQYTGYKTTEVNKPEIYFGDVVNCWGGEYCQGFWEYDNKFEVKTIYHLVSLDNSEFIRFCGNIHDNPELLEVPADE